ncbi:MAG: riboflavin synthase [Actinobacteria bacterium]|nr:riboflavin synthase [Actinomycetota bacterium]
MFTGLVEEVGSIESVEKRGDGARFQIHAKLILNDIKIGDSIAVNGVCLTVVEQVSQGFAVDAVEETLDRSTLGRLTSHSRVNLERALQAESRMGGHFVQGHIDGMGNVISIEPKKPGYWLKIRVDDELAKYFVEKGSIAIDGVSLTIARAEGQDVSIALIPHTWEVTTICELEKGDRVNIEVDILGKYVYKYLHPDEKQDGVTLEKLSEYGFI